MRELRLRGGDIDVVLLPDVGARLHRLSAFGHDLLRTPDRPEHHLREPLLWGGYVMAPWCNRVVPAPTPVAGRMVDLLPNFPDGMAIHGQVYARPWTVDADAATCRIVSAGGGWPWSYETSLGARPIVGGLRLELTLANRSDSPMPAGIGLHPWWRRPLLVEIEADRVYASNTRPSAYAEAAAGRFDRRSLSAPPTGLDATWTGLRGGPVRLAWPEIGVALEMRLSGADYVVIATPDEPDATAVEVQTHAPDGLGRLLRTEPGALRLLAAGEELRLALDLVARRL